MPRKLGTNQAELRERANTLRLYGLLSEWATLASEPWVAQLIALEEEARSRRSQEYRMRNAKIGCFKDRAEYDWKHPKTLDRLQIDELLSLDSMEVGTEPDLPWAEDSRIPHHATITFLTA